MKDWQDWQLELLELYVENTEIPQVAALATLLGMPSGRVKTQLKKLAVDLEALDLREKARKEAEKLAANNNHKTKAYFREDLGIFVRSSWEANVARVLNYQAKRDEIWRWEYEPEIYWFLNIKRGTRSYTPDFKIWPEKNNEKEFYFIEVKGHMDPRSKTKLKRMAKYYPEIKIEICDRSIYKKLEEEYRGKIPEWE
jgi:hypothetical protein